MELFKKDNINMKMGDANVFAIVATLCTTYILLLGIVNQLHLSSQLARKVIYPLVA
jgi:hypothetical protein